MRRLRMRGIVLFEPSCDKATSFGLPKVKQNVISESEIPMFHSLLHSIRPLLHAKRQPLPHKKLFLLKRHFYLGDTFTKGTFTSWTLLLNDTFT